MAVGKKDHFSENIKDYTYKQSAFLPYYFAILMWKMVKSKEIFKKLLILNKQCYSYLQNSVFLIFDKRFSDHHIEAH